MDKEIRNLIEPATQRARKVLEDDFLSQLEGVYDVTRHGEIASSPGQHLSAKQALEREKIVDAIKHKSAACLKPADAVLDFVRDAAFTFLNRFAALKMLEVRDLLQECVSKGEQSSGYKEFCGLAPGLLLLPDSIGYRIYIESIFDELSTEIKVLFDRRDAASSLWPKRQCFDNLLGILNDPALASIWGEDETLGWMYQYFNSPAERRSVRKNPEETRPKNSRELAILNQFFTPKYVVQFLTNNTLGRIWYEMQKGQSNLGIDFPMQISNDSRSKKDPRDLRILDPACGSGHFLIYAFDVLVKIYSEAWHDDNPAVSYGTGKSLREDYPTLNELHSNIPTLILKHNIFGVEIDSRCVQIAELALWMRAQRTYKDVGIARSERKPIESMNIIIAEPMAEDDGVLAEFLSGMGDPDLEKLFSELVSAMRLAGELGLLLRFPQLTKEKTAGGQLRIFRPAHERIREALKLYAEEVATRQEMRRRLFADDATQGLGLLALVDVRFDVVLMNPPFGKATERGGDTFHKDDCGNLYSAFVRRSQELATFVGCISDRTFVTQPTFSNFRNCILNTSPYLMCLADLGWGVLDANVQVAAFVLSDVFYDDCAFLDLKRIDDKESLLNDKSATWNLVSRNAINHLPDSILAYSLPPAIVLAVENLEKLADLADLPRGLGSNKAARTYFSWLELSLWNGSADSWEPLCNGGDFSPYWRQDLGIARWKTPSGHFWVSVSNPDLGRLYDQSNTVGYFRPGLSFPKQSSSFNVAVLSDGFIPTREGKAILPHQPEDRRWLLAFLNSGVVRAFVRDTCGLHKQSGAIGRIPIPQFTAEEKEKLAKIADFISQSAAKSFCYDETSRWFEGPFELCEDKLDLSLIEAEIPKLAWEAESLVRDRFGLDADCSWCEEPALPLIYTPSETDTLSWAVGNVFKRFSASIPKGLPENFAMKPPLFSPAMVQERDKGFDGIFVDDSGYPSKDLATLVSAVLEKCSSKQWQNLEEDPAKRYDALQTWLRKEFFGAHLETYTRARRQSPVYWQFSIPSGRFSVWLYIQYASNDSMYKIQREYVTPKLKHEQKKLESLRAEFGAHPDTSQRAELAAQESLVEELSVFLEQITKLAPLWHPELDDGIDINFAPFWRLTPQCGPWQRTLRATWDDLHTGKYDWTLTAMRLWPEKVIPKCAKDRGLAVAHGLEQTFWAEDTKGKWQPKTVRADEMANLIAERSSAAIKAALADTKDIGEIDSKVRRKRSAVTVLERP